MGQAGHDCLVMTEIPREIDDFHVRILASNLEGDIERSVRRSIVDEHDLEIRRELLRSVRHSATELVEVGRRSVERAYDRESHGRQCTLWTTEYRRPKPQPVVSS